ncbi:MAG: CcdB family protein [Kiloniellales bacterium]
MAQFDVHRNPSRTSSADYPYLLDVQSDLIGLLATRVVVPLARIGLFRPAVHLYPVFEIEGKAFVMSTSEIAGIAPSALGEHVTSLVTERDTIIAAIDFLITGI